MRLFVALEIPAEVRENLAALIRELRTIDSRPRWIRPENLHVTLKFIGEVPLQKADAIRSALASVHSDARVTLNFRGLGFFPENSRPRVFWAGIETSANLKQLALDIDLALEKTGVPRETRPFSPHLTLARFNEERLSEKLRVAVQERVSCEFGTLRTCKFHLIESKLQSGGSLYTDLASFAFFEPEA